MCVHRLDQGDWTWRDNLHKNRRGTEQDMNLGRRLSFSNIVKKHLEGDHSGKKRHKTLDDSMGFLPPHPIRLSP